MPKIHITSLLRPRAAYKTPSVTSTSNGAHQHLDVANAQDSNSDIVVFASTVNEERVEENPQHLVYAETTINNIELIPTLEFVSQTPQISFEHLQECLRTCCAHEESPEQVQHVSETSSRLTFTVDRSTNSEVAEAELATAKEQQTQEEQSKQPQQLLLLEQQQEQQHSISDLPSLSADTSELLQQEVQPISLTDTSLSTYFDEPTSSISIEMMEGSRSQHTTTDGATTSNNITMSSSSPQFTSTTEPRSSASNIRNTTTSQSNVPQSFENPLSSLSDEQDEIEEEIEEAIELSESHGESLDSLPGPSRKSNSKPDQLFGIEFSDSSSADISPQMPVSARNLKSISDDEKFKIDEDQLSGGNLAHHFLVDNEDSEQLSISLPIEKLGDNLQPDSAESLDDQLQEKSLSNQSTSDDVSELQEEPKHDVDTQDSLQSEELDVLSKDISLPYGSNLESLDVGTPKPMEKIDTKSLEQNLSISNLDPPEIQEKSVHFEELKSDRKEEANEKLHSIQSSERYKESLDLSASNKDAISLQSLAKSESIMSSGYKKESLELTESERSLMKPQSLPKLPVDLINVAKPSVMKPVLPELFENPDIKPLSGASSLHSEKDQSIDEILASNHSFEMTLDDENLSSLNPSFLQNNETLVNKLLEDTPDKAKQSWEDKTSLSKDDATPRATKAVDNKLSEDRAEKLKKPEEEKAAASKEDDTTPKTNEKVAHKDTPMQENPSKNLEKLDIFTNEAITSFQEAIPQKIQAKQQNLQYATEHFMKPDFQQIESCGDMLKQHQLSDIVTDLDDSLKENNEQPTTSTKRPQNDAKLQALHIETGDDDEEDEEDTSLQLMKLRILAMKHQPKDQQLSPAGEPTNVTDSSQVKPMERVSLVEFAKDVLEDITEESERNSLSTQEEQQSLNLEKASLVALASKLEAKAAQNAQQIDTESSSSNSIVSLHMVQMLEQKVGELQQMLASKDACLASLNMQLENINRRDSSDQLNSGRDTSSLVTNSTEYRTLQEDFGQPTMDIYMELSKRDELISKLTDSLQQSLTIRENLQTESEKLSTEVQLLRKQLTDAMDTLKRPCWPRGDQESNFGQRISEISMDLISESDDDFERQYFTDNEEKFSRNSRERQLSMPRQFDYAVNEAEMLSDSTPFSKQIEQFQKYLTPSEVRLFFMVQKKFDDYLCQELEKSKMKHEQELKIVMDQWETEKREKDDEIQRMLCQRLERDTKHNQEMEDLRKYFETKCADLEKQYSDDVFSQKSQRQDMSSSESSDQEQLQEEFKLTTLPPRSKEASPRKRYRAELLLSPSHRQMTPGNDAFNEETNTNVGSQLALEITELKTFYQNKIHEIQRSQEDNIKKLNDRLKYYESRYPEDEYMTSVKNSTLNSTLESSTNTEDVTQLTVRDVNESHDSGSKNSSQELIKAEVHGPRSKNSSQELIRAEIANVASTKNPTSATIASSSSLPANSSSPLLAQSYNNNNNSSLIIIDTDELHTNNETQIIQKIIDEYERRLQEQLALAREDIVHELEQQIQTLLSEQTVDDQHWPKELILLREKFTAKSQLEIAQLQIKHAEEMSRLKIDYEKQLNRKNKRHSTFDSVRDFDKLISERDSLRELSKAFRQVLAELLKCVANCENGLTDTLMDEVQRLMSCNRTLEEHTLDDFTLNTTLLNDTLNTTRMRLMPDVHNLMEVIEDPNLVQFVSQKTNESGEDFDLKDCLECLRSEASYLLHLSEDLVKKHSISSDCKDSYLSEQEKNDSEQEDGLKLQQKRKFIRVNSLNEQQLSTHRSLLITQTQNLISLPPDLNRLHQDNNSMSTTGVNAAELHFQLTELKNRLVKSENDRQMLQQELDHTISRNTDLGEELQHLRDQLSQLSSLNNMDYNEGYGLGNSIKSPPRLSSSDHSSSGFAQLQEKARNILSTPTQKQQNNDSTVQLLQMIEDFCREGDKVVECGKKDREDLQSQIDTADKQLKATRQFLEEQAIEREQERDEFLKEIEKLKAQIKDKEKERSSYANASEEVVHLESQIRDLTQKLQDSNGKRDKFEVELKASIDKIFVLREIISDLETQVETKALNEHVMGEKVKQLEEYINSQSRCSDALQSEVQSLKGEIEHGYQVRIHQLEEKLQNIRPTAEQSLIMDQVVEQLRDIENTLEQKTKILESLYQSTTSSVGSLSCPEDVSARGVCHASLPTSIVTPPQGSPIHPSPRQHSWTMEGVQRVLEKLSKHSRVEEAAVKRIRDLEMQVSQMRAACVELQYERESLQERMSEQTQRISALQSRLEEQRQRAEELQRANTSDLSIRIQDLQNELQTVRETLSNRDKQIVTMKQQLEKSKVAIDRLEAELAVEHQPDRSALERLETELNQKHSENQKLKDKIKNEMINKLALPDLMETMLADKNEEIDHLKEQLETKEKQLLDLTNSSSMGVDKKADEMCTKLSARTLSDIVSISEFDEPDVVRRAAACNMSSPLLLPEGSGGFLQNTMETTKGAVANLTHKRTEDLSGFAQLHQANTFDNPHYFQDPNMLLGSAQSGASVTPLLVPRQINFSDMTEDSKLKTPSHYQSPGNQQNAENKLLIVNLEKQIVELKQHIEKLEKEREKDSDDLVSSQLRLNGLQDELHRCQEELLVFRQNTEKIKQLENELNGKSLEIEQLLREQDRWTKEKTDLLSKNEKNLQNLQQSEESYKLKIKEFEEQILKSTEREVNERENLRKELSVVSAAHEQCIYVAKDNESRKKEIENLNQEIKAKDERLLTLNTKLSIAEENTADLKRQISSLEREVEKLKQQSSDNSSRQFSVDEIAKQVEKELNYSAQLDSNILKAIESEEENNLDRSHAEKTLAIEPPGTTDDENFTGERELLNQLEALRAQISVERDHAEEIRKELMEEKQHSQEVQEQDVLIIEAMRKRLESALEQEDALHKQLDIERERCERLQNQLTTQQRTDSRRNSSLLKSPTESPRKSPRSLTDFESELAERLKSEIKLLTAQNERERERSADLQRNSERERSRYEKELLERIEYCDKLKREMEKVARDKEGDEMEIEHLQERLTLQTQEIESLEARIASLQEAETRRCSRKEKHQKENTQLMVEMQDLKTQLYAKESEKESLNKTINQLRYDVERSAQREIKLAEALANANSQLAAREGSASVPEQFMQKMKDINALLAENTQENRQMAETVQYLVEERRQLQRKCEELETQHHGSTTVVELEERCNHLLARYLRVESHRKALVYQKRYLKISLQNYQDSEQRALAAFNGGHLLQPQRPKKKLFKTVALAIIAIERMKYIGRIWHTGKRIVSKSVFTITQQKRSQPPTISCAAITSTSPLPPHITNGQHSPHMNNPLKILERPIAPLKTPTLLNGGNRTPCSAASTASLGTAFEWPTKMANKPKKL